MLQATAPSHCICCLLPCLRPLFPLPEAAAPRGQEPGLSVPLAASPALGTEPIVHKDLGNVAE